MSGLAKSLMQTNYFLENRLTHLDSVGMKANDGWSARFGRIYEENFEDLYRFARWSTSSAEIAEDIVQAAFEALWKFIQKNDNVPDHPRAWLSRVMSNRVKDHYASKKNRFTFLSKLRQTQKLHVPDISSGFAYTEMEEELRGQILALGEPLSEIVFALDIRKENYSEVCRKLMLSERTIRNLRKKAWDQIATELEKRAFPAELLVQLPTRKQKRSMTSHGQ